MKIKLKICRDSEYIEIIKEQACSLEELAKEYEGDLKYPVLLANVDNRHRELWYVVEEDAKIEFLDIRNVCAEKTYHHSLVMVYLKAAHDVLGDDEYVTIENSLNQGYYSNIKRTEIISENEVEAISNRMREIIDQNIPFVKTYEDIETAVEICRTFGVEEKCKLLSEKKGRGLVEVYSLEGYSNYFYGYMVPSTGYLDKFELRKYRNGVLLRFPNSQSPDAIPEYRDDSKVYEAYADTKNWRKESGVYYLADLNEKIRNGQAAELIKLSEASHDEDLAKLAEQIVESTRRIVMIAGPSSSGKTTFAHKLCENLKGLGKDTLYLGTDDYFLDRADTPLGPDGEPDFENLGAIDIELFERDMNALLEGKKVDIPEFDFVEGVKKYGKRVSKINDNQLVVIEGIHCLNDEMSRGIARESLFKIYISPLSRLSIDRHNGLSTTDARMMRRMVRDNRTRNQDAAYTLANWYKVRDGEEKNIFPYSNSADAVFNTSMVYETALLKKYAEPLLKEIGPEREEYGEALRMLFFLEPFEVIEDEEAVPSNSIIREFIGGQEL